jgi:hypothetical protein
MFNKIIINEQEECLQNDVGSKPTHRILRKFLQLSCWLLSFFASPAFAQTPDTLSYWTADSIRITVDQPPKGKGKSPYVILYALPNGNSTEQTFGRKPRPQDDFRFDIQHIGAQTQFIRQAVPQLSITVIYLENNLKSWPAWKRTHPQAIQKIKRLVDSLQEAFPQKTVFHLSGHSGGGSFIFGYLAATTQIPASIQRISFLDSNYGYDSSYLTNLVPWLKRSEHNRLIVFAYNDSIALYKGKRVVSDTGGTWYRSRLMMRQLSTVYAFKTQVRDSLVMHQSTQGNIHFYLLNNTDTGIYHTQQVERNGLIHAVLLGTRQEEKLYQYYGPRAYQTH